jgi:hypothetical protein
VRGAKAETAGEDRTIELARRGEKTMLFQEHPRSTEMPVAPIVDGDAADALHRSMQLRSA